MAAAAALIVISACSAPGAGVNVASTSRQQDPVTNGAAATTTGPAPSTTTTAPSAPRRTIAWEPCDGTASTDCGTVAVPLDYREAQGPTITLVLERHRATSRRHRIGSLLVNPGGPGVSGTSLATDATSTFSQAIVDSFDIVGWDPRGVGGSRGITCLSEDETRRLFALDPTPDTPAEDTALRDAARQLATTCGAKYPDLLAHVSTRDTARDMDQIRQALGEETISYFGFSYGSELGATWATMFPRTVRAMVLDGALDPNQSADESAREQAVGLERGLTNALTDCAKDAGCAFHHRGDPFTAFDKLLADLDAAPLVVPGEPIAVNQGVAYYAIASELYSDESWPELMQALATAEGGNGKGLLTLYNDYTGLGTEANVAIDCADATEPAQTPAEAASAAAELVKLAPRLGRLFSHRYGCTDWPTPLQPALRLDAKGAPPSLVIATTGDPITPIEATTALARDLDKARLVTVSGFAHTGYGLATDCVDRMVDDYLITQFDPVTDVDCTR